MAVAGAELVAIAAEAKRRNEKETENEDMK